MAPCICTILVLYECALSGFYVLLGAALGVVTLMQAGSGAGMPRSTIIGCVCHRASLFLAHMLVALMKHAS